MSSSYFRLFSTISWVVLWVWGLFVFGRVFFYRFSGKSGGKNNAHLGRLIPNEYTIWETLLTVTLPRFKLLVIITDKYLNKHIYSSEMFFKLLHAIKSCCMLLTMILLPLIFRVITKTYTVPLIPKHLTRNIWW